MPNAVYLPVLLVSVTNAIPDDSFVTTQPRAQVDYLSHEWQEEDVWRSWRNMTRQKNEIANGVRLENASWRTWWKQRNKLKTVTPETLNWLKDSDVTWLYGPLHTAADYCRPSKPLSVTDTANTDRADTPNLHKVAHKPILKYRSISELLTSDLPNSPIFSPAESEDEDAVYPPMYDPASSHHSTSSRDGPPKRPTLQHTKSDTHITRWGPNRAFRKDSPPRIEPPGHINDDDQGYFPKVSAGGPVRTSLSQDSNSSAGHSGSTERTAKKKHITFNTFVQQCIAIEKPKRSAPFYGPGEALLEGRHPSYDDDDGYEEDQEDSEDEPEVDAPWVRQRIPGAHDSDSDSPDEEHEEGIIEMRSSYRDTPKKLGPRSQSKVSNTSSSSSFSTGSSSTTNSTANSSPSRDLSSASTTKCRTVQRRTSNSTYRPRPPLIHANSDHMHVTIAPIAPTVLKTTEVWEEGFGDEGAGSDDGFGWRDRLWSYSDHGAKRNIKSRGRGRSGGDDGQGSDGTPVELVYVPPFNSRYGYEEFYDEDDEEVEMFVDEQDYDDEELEEEDYASGIVHSRRYQRDIDGNIAPDVYHHRGAAAGSVGFEDYSDSSDKHHMGSPDETTVASIPIPIPTSSNLADDVPTEGRIEYGGPSRGNDALGIPKVVVGHQGTTNPSVQEEGEFGFFDGPDLGDEYMGLPAARSSRGYSCRSRGRTEGRSRDRDSDERPSRSTSRTPSSRSRSKSHSRTPSPALESVTPTVAGPSASSVTSSAPTLQAPPTTRPPLQRSSSSTSPSSTALLSPPARGRSHQDLLQGASRSQSSSQSQSRGRSWTRTPSSASFESSTSASTSPFGSLSPDGSVAPRYSAAAYVSGGRLDRERERGDKDRRGRDGGDRGRGRAQTTEKRLGVSVSSSPEPPRTSVSTENPNPTSSSSSEVPLRMEASFSSTGSSSSSTKTVVPEKTEEESRQEAEEEYMRRAEEDRRRRTQTPSNSPIIVMRMPAAVTEETKQKDVAALPVLPPPSTPTHTGSFQLPVSPPTSPTPTKTRPPPLIPSPPHPALPSTSYALSTPNPASPKHFIPASPHMMTTASTVTQETRPSLHRSQDSDSSILDKAAGIVTSAGAFFGLWNHHHSSS